jgi:DNA-directed RNA polymerase specialized sigma24 family protein
LYTIGKILQAALTQWAKARKEIAMKNHAVTTVTSSIPTFESLLERMTPHFRYFAKRVLRLKGDDFDDVLQELSAIAYEMYLGLVKRGKEVFFTPLMKFAIKRYRDGRRFAGTNSVDVLSDRTKMKGRSTIKNGDTLYYMLDQRDNVAKTVQFKVDFQDWYHLQTPQDQSYIADLALNYTASEVARRHGVSAVTICHRRKKYATSWDTFIDPPEADSAVIAA